MFKVLPTKSPWGDAHGKEYLIYSWAFRKNAKAFAFFRGLQKSCMGNTRLEYFSVNFKFTSKRSKIYNKNLSMSKLFTPVWIA